MLTQGEYLTCNLDRKLDRELTSKLWYDIDLDFLQPGHEYHAENGRIRYGKGNNLKDDSDTKGNLYVTLRAADGERLPMAKVWLFAMIRGKQLGICQPVKIDPVLCPEDAEKVERLRACGIPFRQCGYCGAPTPYKVVAVAQVPGYAKFYRDKTAESQHELLCLGELMKVPPHTDPRIRILH